MSISKCFNDVGNKHSTLDMNCRLIKIELNRLIMLRKDTCNSKSVSISIRMFSEALLGKKSINFY